MFCKNCGATLLDNASVCRIAAKLLLEELEVAKRKNYEELPNNQYNDLLEEFTFITYGLLSDSIGIIPLSDIKKKLCEYKDLTNTSSKHNANINHL